MEKETRHGAIGFNGRKPGVGFREHNTYRTNGYNKKCVNN